MMPPLLSERFSFLVSRWAARSLGAFASKHTPTNSHAHTHTHRRVVGDGVVVVVVVGGPETLRAAGKIKLV